MWNQRWTISTAKRGDSSAGASLIPLARQWNPSPSSEGRSHTRGRFSLPGMGVRSGTVKALPTSVDELLATAAAPGDIASSQFVRPRQGTDYQPRYRVVALPDLPRSLRNVLVRQDDAQSDDDELYDAADAVGAWIEEQVPDAFASAIAAAILKQLRGRSVGVLLAALADRELHLEGDAFLQRAATFLFSEDKRLAQVAAICLATCGGANGRALAEGVVGKGAPHSELIAGALRLAE